MGITQTTSVVMIFLTGLLPASCHKTAPQQKSASPTVVAVGTNNAARPGIRNLGEISLTNHNETCLWLATGESFTLTPKLLANQNVQITLAVESKNEFGETHNFAAAQVIGQTGKPLEVALGGLNLTFTPRVNQ
jgi:hypothetical protein